VGLLSSSLSEETKNHSSAKEVWRAPCDQAISRSSAHVKVNLAGCILAKGAEILRLVSCGRK
jgi:post-segregation antitoxin (ccd killing protein)